MKPISINYHRDGEVTAATVADAVATLDRIRTESTDKPVMASLGPDGDMFAPALEIGVRGDIGFARYAGVGESAWSAGDPNADGTTTYYFQDHDREIPTSAEVPYEQVQLAVIEYMVRDGVSPASLTI